MNEYDSELVRSILLEVGHVLTNEVESAEVVMLNTCAVRENAFNKIYARVGDLKYYRDNRKTRVGILGCMAQNIKDDLMQNRNIDFAAGPDNYRDLPKLIAEALDPSDGPDAITILSKDETYSDVSPDRADDTVNAWLAVMRGCDNFCTFCVVPYTRGRERSRTLESVVEEARKAVAAGKKQVTLLGQNVNSYRSGEHQFSHLMEAVAQIEGLARVRFTSPHPMDFPEELLRVIAKYPKLCKQIHLPLQAGSSEVLKRMNRGYTREEYMAVVSRIKLILPDAHISTDIIVGFPGETEEQFEETVAVMNLVRFDSAYIYKYSPREGTLAKRRFPDDVEEVEKTRRIVKLNQLQNAHSLESLMRFVGRDCEILIEKESTQLSEQQCQGRTDQGVTVVIPQDGSIKAGDLVTVRISGHTSHVLMGQNPKVLRDR